MNLTDQDVDEILKLLEKSPYDELKIVTERFTLELKSGGARRASATAEGTERNEAPAPADRPDVSATIAGELVEIRAPLPGTFYRAPGPGAEPFTEVGRQVDPDTIVGLVETMKLMNSVVAGCRGEVVEICAQNATLVENGDLLVRIRPSGDD